MKAHGAVTVANHIGGWISSTFAVDNKYRKVFPAKAVTLEPHTHIPVLQTRSGSGTGAQALALKVHYGICSKSTSGKTLNKLFHILLTSMSNLLVHLLKHMVVAHDCGARNKYPSAHHRDRGCFSGS